LLYYPCEGNSTKKGTDVGETLSEVRVRLKELSDHIPIVNAHLAVFNFTQITTILAFKSY